MFLQNAGGGLEQPPGSPFELHPAADTRCSEMASIPQVRGLHLRGSSRLFTAEVRSVIAGMENSFLSLTFIYSLIKEAFAHVGLAARGWRPNAPWGSDRGVSAERRVAKRGDKGARSRGARLCRRQGAAAFPPHWRSSMAWWMHCSLQC